MIKRNHFFIALLSLVFLTASLGLAKDAGEERERSMKAAEVLSDLMKTPDNGIPKEIMEKANAVAVIPHVVKGALGIGGRYGKGLVSHRESNGKWSTPAFIGISGGSFGLQLGVEATDLVLVFTNEENFKGLLDGKVKLGADVGVAAGPIGRAAEVGTDVRLKSAILAYSRSKGLFAGIALDGAVISIDDDANKKVYGSELGAQDILVHGKARMNDMVASFVRALEQYSPARKLTQK